MNATEPRPRSVFRTIKIVVRAVLFTLLAYLLFALAYDFLYVLPTHERKYNELITAMQEGKPLNPGSQPAGRTRRGAAASPADVSEFMGFSPLVPLDLDETSGLFVELYRYHSAVFVKKYDIEVYYAGKQDSLMAVTVAGIPEERPGGAGDPSGPVDGT